MRAAKIGLLLLILMFGATVETAWQVRDHIELGADGLPRAGRALLRPVVLLRERGDASRSPRPPRRWRY